MVSSLAVANGANVALGAFLLVLSAIIWRKSPDRATKLPLAAFLSLVGFNYALDGLAFAVTSIGLGDQLLRQAALFAAFLDPPLLLVFALIIAYGRIPPLRAALVAAPALVVLLVYLVTMPQAPYMSKWELRGLYLAEMASYYLLAFGCLLRAYLREPLRLQRDRHATLVIAFGLVCLPRVPLLAVDFGFRGSLATFIPPAIVTLMVLALGILLLATVTVSSALADVSRRDHVRETMTALAGLMTVVAAGWVLLLVPGLSEPAYAMMFSFRWFLFAAVLSAGLRRHDLLDLSPAAQTRIRAGFTAALYALAIAQLAAILHAIPGTDALEAGIGSLGIVVVGTIGHAALRRAAPAPPADLEWRRSTVYRSRVEIGAPPEELESLRVRLGLSEREAREVERLVALEREARPQQTPLEEGAVVLGRYEVRQFLGAGTFGRVFLAWDRLTSERVVLKELLEGWRHDADALQDFRREADLAMRVQHPNLVAFRSLECMADADILVLDYVEGVTLRAHFAAHGPLGPGRAARLARDLLQGLRALHEAGIVHRDVKPDNIVLRPDGTAVLLDFGAAASTRTGTVRLAAAGTRQYMSPEQARGDTPTPASDVYALGATLWEAITGRPVGEGDPGPAWTAYLRRALDPRPQDRWADAATMLRALPRELVEAS